MIRIMNVIALVLTVSFSYGLYKIKYDTRIAEQNVMRLRQNIETQNENLKVLRAEWSHLNQTERIQRLAEKYLDLKSVALKQIVSLQDVPMRSYVAEETPGPEVGKNPVVTLSSMSPLTRRSKPFVTTRGGDAHG